MHPPPRSPIASISVHRRHTQSATSPIADLSPSATPPRISQLALPRAYSSRDESRLMTRIIKLFSIVTLVVGLCAIVAIVHVARTVSEDDDLGYVGQDAGGLQESLELLRERQQKLQQSFLVEGVGGAMGSDGSSLASDNTIAKTLTMVTTFFLSKEDAAADMRVVYALQSWLAFVPGENIIALVDSRDMCARMSVYGRQLRTIRCHVHQCLHETFELPMLSCMLQTAADMALTPVVAFANADIILYDEFPDVVQWAFVDRGLDAVLMGRRMDVDANVSASLGLNLATRAGRAKLKRKAALLGSLHGDLGIDFFVFPRDMLPRINPLPFLLGTYRWDNWLVSKSLMLAGVHVIDITEVVMVVHQGKEDPTKKAKSHQRAGSSYNDQLTKHDSGMRYRVGRVGNAAWLLGRQLASPKILQVSSSDSAGSGSERERDGVLSETGDGAEDWSRDGASRFFLRPNLNMQPEVLMFQRALTVANFSRLVIVGPVAADAEEQEAALNWACWAQRAGMANYVILAEDTSYFAQRGLPVLEVHASAQRAGGALVGIPMPTPAPDVAQKQLSFAVASSKAVLAALNSGIHVALVDVRSFWMENGLHDLNFGSCDVIFGGVDAAGGGMSVLAISGTDGGKRTWRHLSSMCDSELESERAEKRGKFGDRWRRCVLSGMSRALTKAKASNCTADPFRFPTANHFFELRAPQQGGFWPAAIHTVLAPASAGKNQLKTATGLPFEVLPPKTLLKRWKLWAVGDDEQCDLRSPVEGNQSPAAMEKVAQTLGMEVYRSAGTVSILDAGACRFPPEVVANSILPCGPFRLHLRVLTMNRVDDLKRLLSSLKKAVYDGDVVDLTISIDKARTKTPEEMAASKKKEDPQWEEKLNGLLDAFTWQHGTLNIVRHTENQGLVKQWIFGWKPQTLGDVLLVVEDDIEVSRFFYKWLKAGVEHFYMNASNYDPRVFGLALQNQHAVLGETIHQRYASFKIPDRLPANTTAYLFQLLSTWGSAWFPLPWLQFEAWYADHKDMGATMPCVPTLVTNNWYCKKGPQSLWSIWHVRFAFERGLYNIYSVFPTNSSLSLVTNYKSAGVNFHGAAKQPSHPLVTFPPPQNIASYFPARADMVVHDFHFNKVQAQPQVLEYRPLVHGDLPTCSFFHGPSGKYNIKQCEFKPP